jgi:hypothetical protein
VLILKHTQGGRMDTIQAIAELWSTPEKQEVLQDAIKRSQFHKSADGYKNQCGEWTAFIGNDGGYSCTCPDYTYRQSQCKHLGALALRIQSKQQQQNKKESAMSDTQDTVYTAIQKFHRAMKARGPIPKNKQAGKGSFAYKYADLPSIHQVIKPLLLECELMIVHQLQTEERMQTSIVHVPTGESITSTYGLHVGGKKDSQAFGSAITYGKRYAIGCLLDLDVDGDDDGASSSASKTNNAPKANASDNDDKEWLNPDGPKWQEICQWVKSGNNPNDLYEWFRVSKDNMKYLKSLQ